MVERARVQPKTLDGMGPRDLQRVVHQPTAGAGRDERGRDAEEADLALALDAEVELEEAFVAVRRHEKVDLNARVGDEFAKLRLAHQQTCRPKILVANAMKDLVVAWQIPG